MASIGTINNDKRMAAARAVAAARGTAQGINRHRNILPRNCNFGSVAGSESPIALRPGLATGLPFRLRDST